MFMHRRGGTPVNPDASPNLFIGSGECSVIERRVFQHSIEQHTTRPLNICIFNGTHNALEWQGRPPELAPLSLRLKYRNITEFSLYRYLVPQLCNFQGIAVYADSDMLCLRNIDTLFDLNVEDYDFLSVRGHRVGEWAPSLMVINCARCRFDLEKYFDDIDRGLYSYLDFGRFNERFLHHHRFRIGELDSKWNSFDRYEPATHIIHYTDLERQPWRHANHPFGDVWMKSFHEALTGGAFTDDDIRKMCLLTTVRPELLVSERMEVST